MSARHQPGHVEIAGSRTFYINAKGEYVAFNAKLYRDARPWARGSRRDTREQVL